MLEWSKMYGLAVDAAANQRADSAQASVGERVCCLKSNDGSYHTGVSYGDFIPAEYDAIRSAIEKGAKVFERMIIVDRSGCMHAPSEKAIEWLKKLGSNPLVLYDRPVWQDDVRVLA